MMGSLFNGQRSLALRNNVEILSLRVEVERYKYFSKLMNLYGKFNGFFDSEFESFWEKETGLPWKEWGKL